ncbi:PAS domain S-box protein [Psychroserpens burtonensis]|uniref:PAS domain S-box protein n=1 Tax=Psychroserpens burtonensis TaxID=49278 RepID=UPI000420BFCF|nr:PAS domain S-box protein [Psychroserpens burtonensis]
MIPNTANINILTRALKRERKAKEVAEGFIEKQLRDFYNKNISLSKSLLSEEEFQQNLLDNLVEALIVVDFKGNILKINKEALKLIGFSEKETPKDLSYLITRNKKKLYKLFKKENYNEKKLLLFDFINKKKEKKYVTIKARLLINSKNKPYAYQAIVRDITKQTIRNKKFEEQQKILHFETLILKDLLASDDIKINATNLVKHIAKFLGTDDCVFYAFINEELVQMAATDIKLDSNKKIKNRLKFKANQGIVGSVAASKKGSIIRDTSKHENYIADGEVRFSEITVPILLGDELVGIIDAEHPKKDFFREQQLDVLSRISTLISLYLKNAIHELDKSNKQIELEEAKHRLEIVFKSDSIPRVIESAEGLIETVSHSFLKMFNIPIEDEQKLIGLTCDSAREMLKPFFTEEDLFTTRIHDILKKEQVVLNEILELKDGRYISRDFTPIFHNKRLQAYIWGYKDVTSQTNYDKSLERQNRKYKSIIDNINLGLMEVDNNDVTISVNSAFTRMCGYTSGELVGKIAKNILLNKNNRKIIDDKNRIRHNSVSDIYEIEVITKSGEIKYWLISGAPNTNLKNKVIGSIGVHLDITPLKKLIVSNENLISDLTGRNDELSNYAHMVSHDLKTPLMTVSSCINWLNEDNKDHLNEESLEYISTIKSALIDMDKLISSTLLYSGNRTSKTKNSPTEVQPIVESIINILYRGVIDDIDIKILKPLPSVHLNEVKTRQIFQNIIENACKYRDIDKKSFIKIDWEEHSDYVQFTVKDNGIGIAEEHFEIVFDSFKKLNSRTDSSGIGLSIVKKMIESNGGKVWFDSKIGVGSTFYFTITK